MWKLDQLPQEIYQAIIEAIEDQNERVASVISLSRALPRSPVPQHWIYYRVILNNPQKVLALYHHLRKRGGRSSKEANWVVSLDSSSWNVDAQILADLISLLPNLERLSLNVGTTFAPEHLDDILKNPRPNLVSLYLVFRPYVQTPTYYQFLKGAYFDSLLTHISSWPLNSKLQNLSIVQRLPPILDTAHSFAQPIVFFSLQPLSTLAASLSLRNVTHLRLCIPARAIASFLIKTSTTLNQLKLLDLSTTQINAVTLSKVLAHFNELSYLILDQSGLMPRATELADTGEFTSLGRACALSTVESARDREKEIKEAVAERRAVLELVTMQPAAPSDETTSSSRISKVKKGRRGVSTAAFSIREKPVVPLNASSSLSTPQGGDTKDMMQAIKALEKVRILPCVPSLRSLCVTTFITPTSAQHTQWEGDFTRGWEEGCRTVEAIQKRLFTSKRNKLIRLFRFKGAKENAQRLGNVDEEKGLNSLPELMELIEVDLEGLESIIRGSPSPRLCFGGMDGVSHTEGCGHSIIWSQDS